MYTGQGNETGRAYTPAVKKKMTIHRRSQRILRLCKQYFPRL